jgi:hypothetical protein
VLPGDAFFVIEDLYGGEGLCLCGPNNHTQKTLMKATKLKVTSESIVAEVGLINAKEYVHDSSSKSCFVL